MKAHELAELLLKLPDLPVMINGWGSDEGLGPFEVDAYYIRDEKTIELWCGGDEKTIELWCGGDE